MKKIIPLILIVIAIIGIAITVYIVFKNKDGINDNVKEPVIVENGNECIIQLINDQKNENPQKILYGEKIKAGVLVELDEHATANNVKILAVMDHYVKISREKVKYKIIKQGEAEPYIETIEEEVRFGEEIPAYINDYDPYGPNFNMPLGWDMFIRFEKIR